MLFESDRHEVLCGIPWDADAARAVVQRIVDDTVRHRSADGSWPLHPLDDEGDTPSTGFKGVYLGSAGVMWALWHLQREGAARVDIDPVAGIRQVAVDYLADPDGGQVVPSYLLGEVGILLVLWRMTGSREAADRLHAAIASNVSNPTNESLWGAPGTMLAAWHLWAATSEARWRASFLENVDQLWQTWAFDEQAQCHLWTQDMYGKVVQYFGAGHGFAGNVYPLLKGAQLLDAARRETLYDRCLTTLRATRRAEGDAVNWPAGTYTPRPGHSGMLMQWCHGAPGIVTALADFPLHRSAEVDALLIGGGQAIWRAGPLVKGHGLCHGTIGNGHAFLTLHRRTGDQLWLQRARAFAMHAIAQMDATRQRVGQGRYTLWTGDLGLAVTLSQCIRGNAGLPSFDTID